MKIAALSTALLLLAACSQQPANSGTPTGPVAAVAPPTGTTWEATVVETPDGGMQMGNPNAPIKLVEYGSRTCPVCGAFARAGTQPLEKDFVATGKVSWEFREYMVHGQPDIPASLLGRCVDKQAFFAMLEQMYINQEAVEEKMSSPEGKALFQKMQGAAPAQVATAWADHLGYVDFVKQRGLPEAKARACLADAKMLDRIVEMMRKGDAMGITGTPSFFLNGQKVDAITWPQLESALKAAGA